jgi:hypothetical protein
VRVSLKEGQSEALTIRTSSVLLLRTLRKKTTSTAKKQEVRVSLHTTRSEGLRKRLIFFGVLTSSYLVKKPQK